MSASSVPDPHSPSPNTVAALQARIAELEAQLEQCQRELRQERAIQQPTGFTTDRRHLQAILNNAPISIFVKDTQGRYLMLNPACEALMGYSQAELLGRTDYDIFPFEMGDRCRQSDRQALQADEAITFEEQVPSGDEEHTVLVKKFRLLDTDGNPIAVCGVAIDITERKLAEAALQKSEEHLRLALDLNEIASWDWHIATNEVSWNDNHFRLLGLEPGTIQPSYQEWRNRVHPDDIDRVERDLARSLAQEVDYRPEFRMILPDGSIRWVAGIGQFIYNAAGQAERMVGVMIDITERKQAEKALNQYKLVVSATPDGIALINRDYIYELVNQTYLQFHNKSNDAIVGHSSSDLLGEDVFQTIIKHRLDLCFAGETIRYEAWFTYETIGPQFMRVTYAPYFELDGRISGAVVNVQTLTELKQAETALQASEAKLDDILNSAIAAIFSFWIRADRTWDYIYCSAGCEEIFGYTAQELVADRNLWRSRVIPEDWQAAVLPALAHLFKERSATIEYRFRHKDGTLRWISEIHTSRRDETTDSWIVTIVATDISDRKRTEADLREKEQFLRSIYEGSQEAIFVIDVLEDGDFRYVGLNPAHEQLTGIPTDVLRGKSPEQVLSPEHAAAARQNYRNCVEAGTSIIYEEYMPFLGINHWWLTHLTPLRDEHSRIYRIIGSSTNITDLKQAGAALQRKALQEQALNRVVEAIHHSLDLRTIFSTATAEIAELLGIERTTIMQYRPDRQCWLRLAVYEKGQEIQSTEGQVEIPDRDNPIASRLKQGQVVRVEHLDTLTDPINQELARTLPFPWLLIPIVVNQSIWGNLSLHGGQLTVPLQDEEVELACRIAEQLAIAIHQADLYQQVQIELAERQRAEATLQRMYEDLESIVQDRTRELEASQETLRQSEARFQHLAANVPGMIYQYVLHPDDSMHFTYVSPYCQKIFEVAPEDFQQDVAILLSMMVPDDIEAFNRSRANSIQTGQPCSLEFKIVTPSGLTKWLQATARPTWQSNGDILWDGLALDITKRKQAEAEILRNRDLFEAVFNRSADAIFLVDERHRLTRNCNQRAVELFEADTKEALLGILGVSLHKTPATDEDVAAFRKEMGKGGYLHQEIEYRTCKGRSFWGSLAANVIQVGNEAMILVRITDISEAKQQEAERKQAEDALRKSEEHLRLAMEAAQMGAWSADLVTGEEIWSDQSQILLGFTPGTFDGRLDTFLNRIHPDDRATVQKATEQALQTGTKEVEYRIVLDDQTIRWIAAKGKVFYDESGKPVWLSGVDIDISDRKLAEARIWESLQEKEVLLKEIHHRVKNNLQIISSLLRMQSRQANNSQITTLFQEAQNRVQSMALIHEQFYQSLDFSHINFKDYLETLAYNLFRSYGVDRQQIALTIETDELQLTLNTAIPCGLIINELISNSLKYAFPEGQPGEIIIRLKSVASAPTVQIMLTVEDTGVGIPERVDWETTKSLGLRIVRNLVTQLHGTLTVDCRQGTQFQICFPNALQYR